MKSLLTTLHTYVRYAGSRQSRKCLKRVLSLLASPAPYSIVTQSILSQVRSFTSQCTGSCSHGLVWERPVQSCRLPGGRPSGQDGLFHVRPRDRLPIVHGRTRQGRHLGHRSPHLLSVNHVRSAGAWTPGLLARQRREQLQPGGGPHRLVETGASRSGMTTSESFLYECLGEAGIGEFKAMAELMKDSKNSTRGAMQALCKIHL